jgi:hypothetical protein
MTPGGGSRYRGCAKARMDRACRCNSSSAEVPSSASPQQTATRMDDAVVALRGRGQQSPLAAGVPYVLASHSLLPPDAPSSSPSIFHPLTLIDSNDIQSPSVTNTSSSFSTRPFPLYPPVFLFPYIHTSAQHSTGNSVAHVRQQRYLSAGERSLSLSVSLSDACSLLTPHDFERASPIKE